MLVIAFQSSLELSPECDPIGFDTMEHPLRVSILTRAFARVRPGVVAELRAKEEVSILTRAFARVRRVC